jgi:hypothetical protein
MDEFADLLISSFEAGLPLFEFIVFQEALAISKENFIWYCRCFLG